MQTSGGVVVQQYYLALSDAILLMCDNILTLLGNRTCAFLAIIQFSPMFLACLQQSDLMLKRFEETQHYS